MSPTARMYADRIREAFLDGNDRTIVDIHNELNESQDLYLEVFGVFPATMRAQIKEIIKRECSLDF